MPHPTVSTPKQSDFLAIPETPLAYWLRPKIFELLKQKTLGQVASVKEALGTGEGPRFIRFHWEVWNAEFWQPYVKGGGGTKWVGLEWFVLAHRYLAIIATDPEYVTARIQNVEYMGRKSITTSRMARGVFAWRELANYCASPSNCACACGSRCTQ